MKHLKEPFVVLLIGPPLSGKTSYISKNFPTTDVISRDEIIMEVYGSKDYNLAFNNVDQKEVDRILRERLEEGGKLKKNVIIDMTNMTSKRRKYNLSFFGKDYNKIAIVFPFLSEEEYRRRDKVRTLEESKTIPFSIIESMINTFSDIKKEEGFKKVIYLK